MTTIKAELQEVMEHLLTVLRHLLSSFNQECRAVIVNDQEYAHHITEDREVLLESFEKWNKEFERLLRELDENVNPCGLQENLECLSVLIEENDMELHLLCGQLTALLNEIKGESSSLIYHLEHRPHPPYTPFSYATGMKPAATRVHLAVMEPVGKCD